MVVKSVENLIGNIYSKLGILSGEKGFGGRRVRATLIYQKTEMLHRGVGPALKFGQAIQKLREVYQSLEEAQVEFDEALVEFQDSGDPAEGGPGPRDHHRPAGGARPPGMSGGTPRGL